MKTKLWIRWLRYREGIIALFCLLTVFIIGYICLSFIAENYPVQTLILGGLFLFIAGKRKLIQKLLKL